MAGNAVVDAGGDAAQIAISERLTLRDREPLPVGQIVNLLPLRGISMAGAAAHAVGKHFRGQRPTALILHGVAGQALPGPMRLAQSQQPRHALGTRFMEHLVGPRMGIVVHPDRERERLHVVIAGLGPAMARHRSARGDAQAIRQRIGLHPRVDSRGDPLGSVARRTDRPRGADRTGSRGRFCGGARDRDQRDQRGSKGLQSGSKRSHDPRSPWARNIPRNESRRGARAGSRIRVIRPTTVISCPFKPLKSAGSQAAV